MVARQSYQTGYTSAQEGQAACRHAPIVLRHCTLCEAEAPEPLRKRGLYAPLDVLAFVSHNWLLIVHSSKQPFGSYPTPGYL